MAYTPPQLQRIRADVVEIGTAQISGVSSSVRAGSRTPFDGAFTTTAWVNATSYNIGDAVVVNGQVYNAVQAHISSSGVNDPESDTYNPSGIGTFWKLVDGRAGDLWLKNSGGSSDLYIKAGDVWRPIYGAPLSIALSDNTSATAFSFPAAILSAATIEYSIIRGTNRRMGEMKVINNGTVGISGASLNDYAVTEIGAGSVGVTLGAQVNVSNQVEVTYVTDSQSLSGTMKIVIKGWDA